MSAAPDRPAPADRALDRRAFLGLAGVSAASLLAAGCGWRGGPLEGALMAWDRPNEWLQRALAPARPRAREYPRGSESGGFPAYYVSRALPTVDPRAWRLNVGGLVARPLSLSLDDLARMPRLTIRVRHYCIEGWTGVASWTGVRVSEIARAAGADPAAGYVEFRSFDAGYSSSWDRASATHPQSLIAIGMDGAWLGARHGAPARLYSNLKYGYKAVKYLTDVRFLAARTGGYWEDRGYDWWAGL